MKKTYLIIFAVVSILFSACKKEGPQGPQGSQGPQGEVGPQAKTYNFSLTFDPGETFESFSGITGFDDNDVVMTYVNADNIGGVSSWVQLPAIFNYTNFVPEFFEDNGQLFINLMDANGYEFVSFPSSTSFNFKAVHIKSSGRKANPNVDFTNYEEVKKVFKLVD
jgi:hypothetical protein